MDEFSLEKKRKSGVLAGSCWWGWNPEAGDLVASAPNPDDASPVSHVQLS